MKKYKKHEAEIQRTIKHLKGEGCNPALLYLEGPILEAMEHLYKLSKKYIAARESTAWVYQSRYQCTVETLQDGIMVKQSFFLPIFYVFKFRNGQKLSSHCVNLFPRNVVVFSRVLSRILARLLRTS